MEILVFKTNLTNTNHINEVKPLLNLHPGIYHWNVDLQDIDNVLRVEAGNVGPAEIESLLVNVGYYCKELE
jgi:hypothetical protein